MPLKKTSFSNLYRSTETGVFFVHAKVAGRLIRKSLQTTKEGLAKRRLDDTLATERGRALMAGPRGVSGGLTLAQACFGYLGRYKAKPDVKPRSCDYHQECIDIIRKSLPELWDRPISELTPDAMERWSEDLRVRYSSTRYNGVLTSLRAAFAHAVEMKAVTENLALKLKRASVKVKPINIPNANEFDRLMDVLDRNNLRKAGQGRFIIRFLSLTGARIDEALNTQWSDLNWQKETITFRKTKNGIERTIPFIANIKGILEELREVTGHTEYLFTTTGARRVLQSARAVDPTLTRMSHHKFRHMFATRCIESGVDIPTVSRWLGHQDGGALAMRVYGHLRDDHSKAMAEKVKF